ALPTLLPHSTLRPPPRSTLSPYTTLFRSQHLFMRNIKVMQESSVGPALSMNFDMRKDVRGVFMAKKETLLSLANVHAVNERGQRSEEHTSELQSRFDLVCRLLLEQKENKR